MSVLETIGAYIREGRGDKAAQVLEQASCRHEELTQDMKQGELICSTCKKFIRFLSEADVRDYDQEAKDERI